MIIKPSKLHYLANAFGFELFYKGLSIGSSGVLVRNRRRISNIKLHSVSAKRDRDLILSGHGAMRYLSEIERIEELDL